MRDTIIRMLITLTDFVRLTFPVVAIALSFAIMALLF